MKAKLASCFVLAIISFAVIGVSYSHWSAELTLKGIVKTGSFLIGVSARGTNDDPNNIDAIPNPGWDGSESKDPGWKKIPPRQIVYDFDVASARALNEGKFIFIKDGVKFYEKAKFSIMNAYPGYCPEVVMRIANGGSVPGKISRIVIVVREYNEKNRLIAFGKLIIPGGVWIWTKRPLTGLAIDDIELAYYKLDVNCDGTVDYKGYTIVKMIMDLMREYGRRIQLNPGDCFELSFALLFKQGTCFDPLPMNHRIVGTVEIEYVQWNMVP